MTPKRGCTSEFDNGIFKQSGGGERQKISALRAGKRGVYAIRESLKTEGGGGEGRGRG